jgi:Uri superfamily endonuclease
MDGRWGQGPESQSMRAYQLHILVEERVEISVGSLGTFKLSPGLYIYTGSAKKNIAARISRHLSAKKKLKWHIDFLLAHPRVRIIDVKLLDMDECAANQDLNGQIPIPRFGATDCRSGCGSHLKYIGGWMERAGIH